MHGSGDGVIPALTGKSALVTGASRGIGFSTAVCLAGAGARVVAASRTGTVPHDVPGVTATQADVTDRQAMQDAVDQAAERSGVLDICIANAGVGLVEEFRETPLDDWRLVIEVNVLGVMNALQAALRRMDRQGRGGRLLVNSSAAGVRGEARTAVYSASKAALTGLVQALAVELAPDGITVNAVAPGEIDTEFQARGVRSVAALEGVDPADLRQRLVRQIPLSRLGSAEDVAAVFAFLASDHAAYITGQTIVVDGGQLLV